MPLSRQALKLHGLNLSRRQFAKLATATFAAGLLPAGSALAQTRGGTLVCPINQDPPSMVPALASSNAIGTVGGKIFQALFDLDADRQIAPQLAEAVEMSEDGLTYTFRLRQGARWHDGKPFTADDVLFSLEVVPQFLTRSANTLAKIAETTRVDDHTIAMRLDKPYLPFALALSGGNLPIIPKHIYEGTDYLTNPANSAPVGTGPFKFKEYRRGEYIHLVRNEDYYLPDRPFADEIYFLIIPDAAQRAIAVETGQANVLIPLIYSDLDLNRFMATGDYKVIEGAYDGVGPTVKMNVNKRHPLLGDKRFRTAMTHAINRQRVVDSVYHGAARVMHGPISSATAFFDDAALKKYDYDPVRANALLDEMGLVRGADGMRTKLRLSVPATSSASMRTQELVRLDLAEVGIDITLETPDVPAFTQLDAKWDYDLLLIGPGQFQDPDIGVSRFLLTKNIKNVYQSNTGGYSNPRVDELWEKAVISSTAAEAQTYYTEIQAIVTEDVPDIWLVESDARMLVRKNIDGFSGSPQESYADWGGVHFT